LEVVINLIALKKGLWFCALLLIALSFPLEVYTQSPYPALLPYVLVGLIVLLSVSKLSIPVGRSSKSGINQLVGLYVALVVVSTLLQVMFDVIQLYEGVSAIVVYLLPVIFYGYFSRVASEDEIRWSIWAIAVAGLIGGVYFAYDSYVKLALGHVTAYSQAAFQYSVARAGSMAGEANDERIAIGYRSFGLMESNAVSGAWIVIGALATLALVPRRRRALRQTVVILFGATSLLALNFTAMVAFAFIIYVLEFSGITFRKNWKKRIVISFISLVFIVTILTEIALWIAGGEMSRFVVHNLSDQLALALGLDNGGLTYGEMVKIYFGLYYKLVAHFPVLILVGQGFSVYGFPQGGDIGFLQSLAAFGVPSFLLLFVGMCRMIIRGLRRVRALARNDTIRGKVRLAPGNVLEFSAGVILLVLITDLHYSVWPSKSVLPVVFFAIALYARYAQVRVDAPDRAGLLDPRSQSVPTLLSAAVMPGHVSLEIGSHNFGQRE
jgi:hypothetical protein